MISWEKKLGHPCINWFIITRIKKTDLQDPVDGEDEWHVFGGQTNGGEHQQHGDQASAGDACRADAGQRGGEAVGGRRGLGTAN